MSRVHPLQRNDDQRLDSHENIRSSDIVPFNNDEDLLNALQLMKSRAQRHVYDFLLNNMLGSLFLILGLAVLIQGISYAYCMGIYFVYDALNMVRNVYYLFNKSKRLHVEAKYVLLICETICSLMLKFLIVLYIESNQKMAIYFQLIPAAFSVILRFKIYQLMQTANDEISLLTDYYLILYRINLLVTYLTVCLKLNNVVDWQWKEILWNYWIIFSILCLLTVCTTMILLSKLCSIKSNDPFQFDTKGAFWLFFNTTFYSIISCVLVLGLTDCLQFHDDMGYFKKSQPLLVSTQRMLIFYVIFFALYTVYNRRDLIQFLEQFSQLATEDLLTMNNQNQLGSLPTNHDVENQQQAQPKEQKNSSDMTVFIPKFVQKISSSYFKKWEKKINPEEYIKKQREKREELKKRKEQKEKQSLSPKKEQKRAKQKKMHRRSMSSMSTLQNPSAVLQMTHDLPIPQTDFRIQKLNQQNHHIKISNEPETDNRLLMTETLRDNINTDENLLTSNNLNESSFQNKQALLFKRGGTLQIQPKPENPGNNFAEGNQFSSRKEYNQEILFSNNPNHIHIQDHQDVANNNIHNTADNHPEKTTRRRRHNSMNLPEKRAMFSEQAEQDEPEKHEQSKIEHKISQQNQSQFQSVMDAHLNSMMSQSRNEKSGINCLICFDKYPDSVFFECGHGGVCYECSLDVWRNSGECFLCRKPISHVIQVDPTQRKGNFMKVISSTQMVQEYSVQDSKLQSQDIIEEQYVEED